MIDEPLARTPRSSRYDSLDLWRGIACLMVVLYHSTLVYLSSPLKALYPLTTFILDGIGRLWIGVPLFFVISGYCIAASADRSRWQGDSLTRYFVRRFRRIYPPLWIAIIASVAFFFVIDVVVAPHALSGNPWSQPRPWWYSAWQWAGNLTLTETWRHHVIGDLRAHFPGQAWTLCYEEQFYLVVGALLLTPRYFFQGIVGVTAATVGVMWAQRSAGWDVDGFFFDGNWLMFAAGILVFYSTNYRSVRFQRLAVVSLVLLAGVAILSGVRGMESAFLFAALLVVLRPYDLPLVSSAAARPFNRCGQMCYSLYLVHQLPVKAISSVLASAGVQSGPATLLITIPLCVTGAVALGWTFHVLVERRFLNSRPREVGTTALPSLALISN